MKNKLCIICKNKKSKNMFCINKSYSDGLDSRCAECKSIQRRNNYREKKGVVSTIYSSQKQNSENRCHTPPTYTKIELKEWLYSQPIFHRLYDNWKRLDYQKEYKPSVDRKDNSIGYTIDNIQLMTWEDNNKKANTDIRCVAIIHGVNPQRGVIQFDIDGLFLSEYTSLKNAERSTGVSEGSISSCCSGDRKKAGGYIWKYKEKKCQ